MKELTSLMDYCDAFGLQLLQENSRKTTYNQYMPMVRDTFIEFLEKTKTYQHTPEGVKEFLTYSLIPDDIIYSAVAYAHKNTVYSIDSIPRYLTAISRFINFVHIMHPDISIWRKSPFTSLTNQIIEILEERKKLQDKEKDPPITAEEFDFIIHELTNDNRDSLVAKEQCAVIMILLHMGLKFIKISALNIKDFNAPKNSIIIASSENKEHYEIYLPKQLSELLKEIIDERTRLYPDVPLLFVNSKGKEIPNSFLTDYLRNLRKRYIKTIPSSLYIDYLNEKNHFTPTGLLKYALIALIESGTNLNIIADFTGNQKDTINDCQSIFDQKELASKGKHINSRLSLLPTSKYFG